MPGNDRTLSGKTFSQDKFTEVAIEFVREHKNRPFFLYMPFTIPHLSIQVPDSSLEEYKGRIPEENYEHKGYLQHPNPRAGYAAMISHLDQDIGKLMDELRFHGLDEDTLVIFTSDNGPTFNRLGGSDSEFFNSAAGFRGLKGSLYEGGIRVPMIARWPGKIAANSTSNRQAAFWDVMPTVAELVHLQPPDEATGMSFLPDLLGNHGLQPEYLYWEFPGYGGQQAIRRGSWKAIRQNLKQPGNPDPLRVQLYDLSVDPSEANDVSAENPDVVAELATLMAHVRVPSEKFPIPTIDHELKP